MPLTLELIGAKDYTSRLQAYPNKATRALVRTLNRGINSARTFMVQNIARETGLKSKDVRDALKLKEANATRLEASLGASLKRLMLIKFGARGPEPSRGRGRGVSYRLASSRHGNRHPNAFIATMRSGHRGVFVRSGASRLQIRELPGPSLGAVFAKYRPAALSRAQEMMDKNLAHELQFASTEAERG